MGVNAWLDRWAKRNQGGYDIREVFGARGNFVIRLEPTGTPSALGFLSNSFVMVAGIWRLVNRDRRWVINVRRRADDPDGPIVHSELFESHEAARPRLDLLEREYRTDLPTEQ